jgi:small subunit ribosomal protein S21
MAHRNDRQHRDYTKRDIREYEYRSRNQNPKSSRPSHVTIEPKGNEHIDKTIKRFLRKVKKSGLADDYKKNRYFEKPSTKRRKEKKRREAVLKKLREKEGN